MKFTRDTEPRRGRGLMLVAALLELATVVVRIQEYRELAGAGIFSPEAWEPYEANQLTLIVSAALLAALFLFQFVTWNLPRKCAAAYLREGVAALAAALVWAASGLLVWKSELPDVLWVVPLPALAGVAIYNLYQYRKIKNTHTDTDTV